MYIILSISYKTWHNTGNRHYDEEEISMKNYVLTVFSKEGEKLLDESFTAQNDEEAKELGQKRLDENDYSEHTHRCVAENARLVLFHR